MNYRATVINCLTAGYPDGANIPVHFDTDREVIDAALAIIGTRRPEEARIMRIRNTLCLEEMEVSESCLGDPEPADGVCDAGGGARIDVRRDGEPAAVVRRLWLPSILLLVVEIDFVSPGVTRNRLPERGKGDAAHFPK